MPLIGDLQCYSGLFVKDFIYDLTLSDSIVYCTNLSYQNHQQTYTSYCNATVSALSSSPHSLSRPAIYSRCITGWNDR